MKMLGGQVPRIKHLLDQDSSVEHLTGTTTVAHLAENNDLFRKDHFDLCALRQMYRDLRRGVLIWIYPTPFPKSSLRLPEANGSQRCRGRDIVSHAVARLWTDRNPGTARGRAVLLVSVNTLMLPYLS